MIAEYTLVVVLLLAGLAEWLHQRRCRRVALLAFGPLGQPSAWTKAAPYLRVLALGCLAWGLLTLFLIDPRGAKPKHMPEGGYRHLIVALDVSPSMQLKDAGPTRDQARGKRAGELLLSVLSRSALEQVRVSVIAFYSGAKPVVVDTFDLAVIKNIVDDLPLEFAFDPGKTKLMDGIKEAAEMAKPWRAGSTTLLVLSDGDTVPETGMPSLPPSIGKVLVVGVGDPHAGKFIDGHQSRQDASTLRQVAARLRGTYHDGNEKHLPSQFLTELATAVPMRDQMRKGRRELALVAVGIGGMLLASLPVALALCGSFWMAGRRSGQATEWEGKPKRKSEAVLT